MRTDAELAAQSELREIVQELTTIRYRLRGIAASLPRLEETAGEDEEEQDRVAALRSALECIVADQVSPAIRDLGRALAVPAPQEQPA